ncbi:MAG: pseudouridine synthase [Chitinophagales bacterium]|nr:pseudouridine synthase [Chitinophagales bacterium]
MTEQSPIYFFINKPYGVISQFSGEPGEITLANLFPFPKDVYPVGRLDKDSEGLLIITNDKALTDRLLHPKNQHERTYHAQVEGIPNEEDIQKLALGVSISIDGKKYQTKPCRAKIIESANTAERVPPIRVRKSIPTSWLELNLIEGKNRQVRKMTAAIGFPTLRLIRVSIENLKLADLQNEICMRIDRESLYKKLNLR